MFPPDVLSILTEAPPDAVNGAEVGRMRRLLGAHLSANLGIQNACIS